MFLTNAGNGEMEIILKQPTAEPIIGMQFPCEKTMQNSIETMQRFSSTLSNNYDGNNVTSTSEATIDNVPVPVAPTGQTLSTDENVKVSSEESINELTIETILNRPINDSITTAPTVQSPQLPLNTTVDWPYEPLNVTCHNLIRASKMDDTSFLRISSFLDRNVDLYNITAALNNVTMIGDVSMLTAQINQSQVIDQIIPNEVDNGTTNKTTPPEVHEPELDEIEENNSTMVGQESEKASVEQQNETELGSLDGNNTAAVKFKSELTDIELPNQMVSDESVDIHKANQRQTRSIARNNKSVKRVAQGVDSTCAEPSSKDIANKIIRKEVQQGGKQRRKRKMVDAAMDESPMKKQKTDESPRERQKIDQQSSPTDNLDPNSGKHDIELIQ